MLLHVLLTLEKSPNLSAPSLLHSSKSRGGPQGPEAPTMLTDAGHCMWTSQTPWAEGMPGKIMPV